jgi:UDP-glucose 4-epimerase
MPGAGRENGRAGGRGRVVAFAAAGGRRPRMVVTGGAGPLGSRFVRALAARGTHDIVVLDLVPPPDAPPDVRHRFLDLNLPHADGTVYKLLKEERPDAVVHLAQIRSPSPDATYVHELNAIGSLHVLAAAGEAKVGRLILGSTTLVYGARGDNPNYLTEEHPLRPDPQDRFVRDFVEAESHARAHVRRYPEAKVTVLRFAPFMSADVRDYRAKLLGAPFAVTLLGYDPLVQALHTDDAVQATLLAFDRPEATGVFNIAPEGVLPISSARLLFGSLPVPVPHGLAYVLYEAAWELGIGLMPGIHAHYLRYLCVADNRKARRLLGFVPRRTTLDVMLELARARRGGTGLLDFDKLDEIARVADFHHEFRAGRPDPPPGREARPPEPPKTHRPRSRATSAAAGRRLTEAAS